MEDHRTKQEIHREEEAQLLATACRILREELEGKSSSGVTLSRRLVEAYWCGKQKPEQKPEKAS